jgi:hypothetical protein
MARTDAPKPLVSRGYGKIVGLTLLAILIGVGLMGFEIFGPADQGGYGGDISATRKPPVKVPSSLPPVEKTGPQTPVPAGPMNPMTPMPDNP